MLCNAMEDDLLHYQQYFDEYKVGNKLGGEFSEVGRELKKEYGFHLQTIRELPRHRLYNMDANRIKKIEEIFEQNVNEISGRVTVINIGLGKGK